MKFILISLFLVMQMFSMADMEFDLHEATAHDHQHAEVERDQDHQDCEHADGCVLHCLCHHLNTYSAEAIELRDESVSIKLAFAPLSMIYLDPFLDHFLRPPLSA